MSTEVHFPAGCHIAEAARQLVDAAQNGVAFGHFNDIQLNATPGTTAESIVEFFNDETTRQHEEYLNSPTGKAAAVAREQSRRNAQAAHDGLMAKLRTLDFSNDAAVLDWLCAMQGPSDHIGVILQRQTIVQVFGARGFVEGANCGTDYKPGNRENMYRYLVGQALNGIKSGPAIHPILHKFVGEWKAQFCPEAVSVTSPIREVEK
jgi:hypothetical protein